ncbi:hypothetical protein ACA351_04540 [Orientia tsutsugamushi]
MNELVERVADEGYFFELQPDFAKNIIRLLSKLDNDVKWCYKNLI